MLALAAGSPLIGADYLVAGVVLDSMSRAPVANARVSLAPTNARDQKLEQITNKEGLFSFAVNQAGKYSLRMNKPGYPLQGYQQAPGSSLASAVVVSDGQDTQHIVFAAHRGAALNQQINIIAIATLKLPSS